MSAGESTPAPASLAAEIEAEQANWRSCESKILRWASVMLGDAIPGVHVASTAKMLAEIIKREMQDAAAADRAALAPDALRVPCKSCGGKDTAKASSAQCYNCRNRPHWKAEGLEDALARANDLLGQVPYYIGLADSLLLAGTPERKLADELFAAIMAHLEQQAEAGEPPA